MTGAPTLAEDDRRDERDELLGAVLGDERRVQLAAALDQRLEHVVLGRQAALHRVEVDAVAVDPGVDDADVGTGGLPRVDRRRPACASVVYTVVGASEASASGPSTGTRPARVEQHAARLAPGVQLARPGR